MKPSGRRRFRKMNARFRQRGSDVVRERARETSAGRARKLIFVEFWGRDPVVMPPRPFSPRSLVGATQGARKRAVLREMQRDDHPQHGERLDYWEVRAKYRLGERLRPCPGCFACLPGEPGVCAFCGCDGCGCDPEPCELCRRVVCGPCSSAGGGAGATCPSCSGGLAEWAEEDDTEYCDGSGVLPAKRHRRCGWWLNTRTAKNATQRCGMPLTSGGWLDCQHCGGSGWLMGRGE